MQARAAGGRGGFTESNSLGRPLSVNVSEYQADYRNSDHATAQTVATMGDHVRAAMQDPVVQHVAAECWALAQMSPYGPPVDDAASRAAVCWGWCKRNIRFVTDEEQLSRLMGRHDELELLISPSVMVRARNKAGDCDCITMMCDALLGCLGVTPLFKTFKCDRVEPWRWAHICAAGLLENGDVLPLDASHGEFPGWEVPAQDVYASQLWDMYGRKVGPEHRMKGLGEYTSDPGWTGNAMTASGPSAGPYGNQDDIRAQYRHLGRVGRRLGLQGIARRKFGMGDCIGGFDEYGMACTDFTPITSDPTATAAAINYLYNTPPGTPISTIPPAGISSSSWANLLAALVGPAASLTRQAIATPGTIITPQGTIYTGTATGQPSVSAALGGISSGTLLLIGGIVVAVMLLKK